MYQFYGRMLTLDTNELVLVFLICALGCLIMKAALPNPVMALGSFPLLVVSALAARVLMQGNYFVVAMERGPGVAFTTGVGMIVALCAIVFLVRMSMFLKDTFGRRPELLQSSDERGR